MRLSCVCDHDFFLVDLDMRLSCKLSCIRLLVMFATDGNIVFVCNICFVRHVVAINLLFYSAHECSRHNLVTT